MESSFIMPQKCCMCMGPKETTVTVSKSKTVGNLTHSWNIGVPICNNCYESSQKPNEVASVIAVGSCIAIGGLIGALSSGHHQWLIGLIGGGVLGFFAGAGIAALISLGSAPAQLKIGWRNGAYSLETIEFKNQEYQKLFDEANRDVFRHH